MAKTFRKTVQKSLELRTSAVKTISKNTLQYLSASNNDSKIKQ